MIYAPIFLSAISGALLLAPGRAAAEPAPVFSESAPSVVTPPPPIEYPPPGSGTRMVLTGAGLFAGWYALSVGQSFWWSEARSSEKLRIPVVGPWFTVARAGCAPGEVRCSDVLAVVRAVVAGISAIGQVGGLAVMAEGAFMRTGGAQAPKPKKASLFHGVSVAAGSDSVGVGLSGAF